MKGYVTIEDAAAPASAADPAVSVIVPAYNAAPFLDQALTSLEDQTLSRLEILVINDGSTDDTLAIAREHGSRDARIRIIDRPNGGYGSACNRGLAEARGTWVAILEPDDWILPDMYRAMTAFAGRFSEAIDIVKTPYWRICDPDTPRQQRLHCSYHGRVKPKGQPFTIDQAPHLLRHHPSVWSALYRREFLEAKGIRFPEYPGAGWADNPFLVETLCQAAAIAYLDEPFYCYREETPEEHAAFVRRSTVMPLERWQAMMDILDRLGETSPAVMDAMNRRAFQYLNGIVGELGLTDQVREAAAAVFERMDESLVLADAGISPANKRLFASMRGLAEPTGSPLAYAGSLVEEGLYTLRNNGVGYTLKMIGSLTGR